MVKKSLIAIITILCIVVIILYGIIRHQKVVIAGLKGDSFSKIFENIKQVSGDLKWITEGECYLLANKHLLICDHKGNLMIKLDHKSKHGQSDTITSVFNENSGRNDAIRVNWFDNNTLSEITLSTRFSRFWYNCGDKGYGFINRNGEWSEKSDGSNKWFRVGAEWYPKIKETTEGSIVEINGCDYVLKFGSTGCVLRAVGASRGQP